VRTSLYALTNTTAGVGDKGYLYQGDPAVKVSLEDGNRNRSPERRVFKKVATMDSIQDSSYCMSNRIFNENIFSVCFTAVDLYLQ
jgi:hypothetical protein